MEEYIFPRADVREQKVKFIEARLHADATDHSRRPRIAELIEEIAGTIAQPTYVTLDPESQRELARFNGKEINKGEFTEFLRLSLDSMP